jgi:hypothetical protein
MEEDIQYHKSVTIGKTGERIDKRLHEAIDKATERGEYEIAHDKDLLMALSIVEDFIKRKKRVCYGGTAMNALLPTNKKFYNPDRDLPDYDFYTPEADDDVDELVKELKSKGFKEVHHKLGIHEGTKKVLVNYIAVADVSSIDKELFNVLLRRSILKEGVRYTDPDILRMMMYLELSRPRGMVSRWEKVFERLELMNKELPMKVICKGRQQYDVIPVELREKILGYGIENKRIICNGPLAQLYRKGIRQGKARYEIRGGGPLLFTSPDPKADAKAVKKLLGGEFDMYMHKERGELVPLRIELRQADTPICMFIQETACHSYNMMKLPDGRSIRVASLEFLITLYLSIDIFTANSTDYLGDRIMCQVKEFIALAKENYGSKRSQFPAFSLKCEGHQVGYTSLLRAKVERVKEEVAEQKRRTRREKRRAAKAKKNATKKKGSAK